MTNFTPQQDKLISAIAAGDSVAARAVAGSGKSTTLVEGLRRSTRDGLALAFNKKNAEDLKLKLGAASSVEAKTLNGLGHKVWSDHLRKRLAVDSSKTSSIVKEMALSLETDEWTALMKMVSIAKANVITPGLLGKPAPDYDLWRASCQLVDIPSDLFDSLANHATEVLRRSVKQAWEGKIDFDDQLYMPVLFDSRFPSPSLVAVDEAQDLSPLQHEMVARLRAKQLIVVGDPAQAIYGFRGASESSYAELVERFALEELPLTVSFRCPLVVGELARDYVPDFSCRDGAPAGTLTRPAEPELAPGAIICRFNAPLIRLAFRAIRRAIPINYLGRDFIAGLRAIHKKAPTPAALERWLEARLKEAKTSGAKSRAKDQHDSLIALHEGGIPMDEALSRLSAPSSSPIVLSTVHKAKGMEWSTTTFLGYDPHIEGGQERNINYVGVTRAMSELRLIEERR